MVGALSITRGTDVLIYIYIMVSLICYNLKTKSIYKKTVLNFQTFLKKKRLKIMNLNAIKKGKVGYVSSHLFNSIICSKQII